MLPTSFVFTFIIRVHLHHSFSPSSFVFTFIIHVHLRHSCSHSSFVSTIIIRVHLPHSCSPSSFVFTFITRVHIHHSCSPISHEFTSPHIFTNILCDHTHQTHSQHNYCVYLRRVCSSASDVFTNISMCSPNMVRSLCSPTSGMFNDI